MALLTNRRAFLARRGLLLLLKEVDNELLVVQNKIIREAFLLEIVTKVLSPLRVKGIQYSKLGFGFAAVGAVDAAQR